MSANAPTLRIWVGLAAVLGLSACASGSSAALTSPASTGSVVSATSAPATVPVGEPTEMWVAVLDTAADPGRLNDARKDVLRELGDVLEGSVVISPGACLQGLPDDLTDGYVLAIQRASRQDVRSLVSLLSQEPSFTGGVTIVCSD